MKRVFTSRGVNVGSRIIVAVMFSLVCAHLIIMYFYIQGNQYALRAANRDAMIQKIINAIHLVNATPTANRVSAVKAMDDPNLSVSITDDAKWKLRFHEISFWEINRSLRIREIGSFAISIRMPSGKWLNCRATLNSHVLTSQLLLISLELMMAIALLISAWSLHAFARPLSRFKEAAERLGVDLQAKPLLEYGPAIVRETADAMNKMQQRIQELVHNRTKMLAAISHDLRTPITRLKLRAHFMTEDKELFNKTIADLNEMEEMISQILSFARQDAVQEKKNKLDIVSLITTICDEMTDLQYRVTVNSSLLRQPFIGRSLALKRAFTNLITNAVNHAKEVEVLLEKNKKYIIVSIIDNGPGIPEKDLNRVFMPFYRSDASRSRHTGGVGLGLAVTKDIIQAHRGKITLNNRQQGGLEVIVTLPLSGG